MDVVHGKSHKPSTNAYDCEMPFPPAPPSSCFCLRDDCLGQRATDIPEAVRMDDGSSAKDTTEGLFALGAQIQLILVLVAARPPGCIATCLRRIRRALPLVNWQCGQNEPYWAKDAQAESNQVVRGEIDYGPAVWLLPPIKAASGRDAQGRTAERRNGSCIDKQGARWECRSGGVRCAWPGRQPSPLPSVVLPLVAQLHSWSPFR